MFSFSCLLLVVAQISENGDCGPTDLNHFGCRISKTFPLAILMRNGLNGWPSRNASTFRVIMACFLNPQFLLAIAYTLTKQ